MGTDVSHDGVQSALLGFEAVDESEKKRVQRKDPSDLSLSVQQIEYSTQGAATIIHFFGRDASARSHHVQITGFRPYFYAPVSQVDQKKLPPQIIDIDQALYHTIQGKDVRRLYTARPTDVRDIRHQFTHYEADIPFATRYAIDQGITSGICFPLNKAHLHDSIYEIPYENITPCEIITPSRYCILDIECEDDRGGLPYSERDSIICMTCWDSFDDAYTCFIVQNSEKTIPLEYPVEAAVPKTELSVQIKVFPTEKEMLLSFAAYIKEKDPDILTGWNFIMFDMPFISGRIKELGIAGDILARLSGSSERSSIRGRVAFDLLSAYKRMQSSKLESYRLDAVGKYEVGEVKAFHYEVGMTSRFWKTDHAKLIEYNLKDVELCVKINQKNSVIEFYQEIARYAGCPLDRTLNSSQVIDVYVLRKAFNRFILPSKGFADANEFEGATVFEPSKGLIENVVVLDLKSLYPMAMMTMNASPETKSADGEFVAPNGIRFKKEPDGLTRSIIRELLQERDEKKNLRNTFVFGSDLYHLYDMQQSTIKVIMNSYYGVSGYARFRLYDRDIGSAVTSVGRAIISHTRKVVEEMGYRVVYGDTDSCMIHLPAADLDQTIERAREIESRLNKSYDTFAKDVLHADTHYFSIKFEKVYRRFFQGGKKKRYAGSLVWKEGQCVDETDMVGFETKRSDSPKLTRDVQKEMMDMILRGGDLDTVFSDVKAYLGDVIKAYRAGKFSLDDIGIPGGIGKNLDSYESDDAHVRGAKYANEHLGTTFTRGSKPKRVYIKQVLDTYPKTDVVCFEYGDLLPPAFVVDTELMLDKTIKQPISRIIEPIGWTWTDVDPSRTTLADFF